MTVESAAHAAPLPARGGLPRALELVENAAIIGVLAAMTIVPLLEFAGRAWLGRGIQGAFVLVQHLTLWLALLGAALAARSDRLLALSTARFLPARWRRATGIVVAALGAGIAATLCYASFDLVRVERRSGDIAAWGIPAWVFFAILPAGFGTVAARLVWHGGANWRERTGAAIGLAVPVLFATVPELRTPAATGAAGVVLAVATVLGLPVFASIGGTTLLLLWADGTPVNAVPLETYRLTTSDLLPAIPLFALAGYVLAEGDSSRRLTRLFTALTGWMPGGPAIAVTTVLALFTPLTGASGITIVSMGGLLLPVLHAGRYSPSTSLGLVTVSGSIGLLFFPSIPVFLYAFYAKQPFQPLFIGGLLPGLLLVVVVAGWAAARGWAAGARPTPFNGRDVAATAWQAKYEIGLPVVVLGSIMSGRAGLVEAAALTVLYAVLVECVFHRGLRVSRDLPRLAVESATLIGGFMIILSVALGFTNYLILADVPGWLLDWIRIHIESRAVFLLALNILLVVIGALMDIYSAIVIVVPVITPLATAYGINPVHLGIIFLANMELGYLMPPMGENLFLAAYRFNRPLGEVYRATVPYTLMLLAAVLVITYVPALTLWLVNVWE